MGGGSDWVTTYLGLLLLLLLLLLLFLFRLLFLLLLLHPQVLLLLGRSRKGEQVLQVLQKSYHVLNLLLTSPLLPLLSPFSSRFHFTRQT